MEATRSEQPAFVPCDSKVEFGLLEMHVSHACNLTCESCSHFSSSGHRGMLTVDDAQASMQAWSNRVKPKIFRLLGGEPTLNPHLTEILYVARENWPQSRLALTTNGFFLSRHRGLPRALHELNVDVTWTIHHRSPEYSQRAAEIRKIWDSWLRSGRFGFHVANASDYWTRRYHGRARLIHSGLRNHRP